MNSINEQRKIIKAFYSIGLNESKITKYDEDIELKYIQKIDIIQKARVTDETSEEINIGEDEKWIRIIKGKDYWLRMQYSISYEDPITNFKIKECKYDPSAKYLLLSKTDIDEGYKPIEYTDLNDENRLLIKEYILQESESIEVYDSDYYKIPMKFNMKERLEIPFKSEAVLLVTRNMIHLPVKDIKIKRTQTSYQFGLIKHKSPFQYTYLPEVIDTYPLDTPMNPGIAMFCFPEGITIKKAYEPPKWFCFILTDETGLRTYGSVVIFTEDLSRELIHSLIPIYKTKDIHYIEKAICILSYYPFFYNCKAFLKELYKITVSNSSLIPLERVICHFVDSLYFQSLDKMISLKIGDEDLKFYTTPIYGIEWDINEDSIEVLFSFLSFDTILSIWEALMLERKVFMLCSSKSILLHMSMALISLLFPFQWMHILVPILPEKLKVFLESPVPLLVGINFSIDIDEFPEDAIILNIEKNQVQNCNDNLPKLPTKLYDNLSKKAKKIKGLRMDNNKMEDNSNRIKCFDDLLPEIDLNYKNKIDCNEIRDLFYEFFIGMFKNYEQYFNWKKKAKDEPLKFLKDCFLKDHSSLNTESFLYQFCDTSLFSQFEDSFNYMQGATATSFFIDSIKNGKGKAKSYLQRKVPIISSVIPEMKNHDLKQKVYMYKTFPILNNNLYIKTEVPKALYKTRFMYMRDEWCYDLTKLSVKDFNKYLMYSIYEIWFTSFSFIIHFYDDKKACTLMDHAMFLIEDLIHKHNITPSKNLLTKMIKSCGRNCLTSFANPLLNLVNSSNQKFNALFHNAFMNGLYALTENLDSAGGKNNSLLLKNSLLNSVKVNGSLRLSCIKLLNLDNIQNILDKMIFMLYELCPNCVINTNTNTNTKVIKKISIEELLSGFSRGKSDFASICPLCLNKIFPKLYLFDEEQNTLDVDSVNFLSPIVLVKEVDNLIKNNGEKYFYHEEFHRDTNHRNIFWNLAFYFQLLDLPLCVLFLQNDDAKFQLIASQFNEAKKRRGQITKTQTVMISNTEVEKNMNDNEMRTKSKQNTLSSGYIDSDYTHKQEIKDLEESIWKGIRSKMEKSKNMIMDNEKTVDKSELNIRLSELKPVISTIIDNFLVSQSNKLEAALMRINKEMKELSSSKKNIKMKNISIIINTNKDTSTVETKADNKKVSASKNETDSLNLINLREKYFAISPKGKKTLDIKINLNK